MERFLILTAEIGAAAGVAYSLFGYLFKNAFREMTMPLKESLDSLSFNVKEQTKTLIGQQKQLETLENRLDGHNTRITVIEHDHQKEKKG